jgi:hypothetical protein
MNGCKPLRPCWPRPFILNSFLTPFDVQSGPLFFRLQMGHPMCRRVGMIFTASGNNCLSNPAVCFKQFYGMEYPAQETAKEQLINTFAAAHHIHFNPLSTLSATLILVCRTRLRDWLCDESKIRIFVLIPIIQALSLHLLPSTKPN